MLGSRRTLAAFSFGVVVFGAGCGGSGFGRSTPAAPTTTAPRATVPVVVTHDPALRAVVVRAVPVTAAAHTARTSISVTLTGLGDDALSTGAYDIAGSGVVDLASGDADLKLSIPLYDRLGSGGVIEQRTVRGVAYTKLPADILAVAGLPPTVRWLSLDPNQAAAGDPSTLSQSQVDPAGQLAFLASMSDDVRTMGREPVRGVTTTHYAATIDLTKGGGAANRTAALRRTLARLGSGVYTKRLAVDVWLDRVGRARRVVVSVPLDPKAGSSSAGSLPHDSMLRIQGDFYAFGTPVRVTAPPQSRVRPYSALRIRTPAA